MSTRSHTQGRASQKASETTLSTSTPVTCVPKGPRSHVPFLKETSAFWFTSVPIKCVLIIVIIDNHYYCYSDYNKFNKYEM